MDTKRSTFWLALILTVQVFTAKGQEMAKPATHTQPTLTAAQLRNIALRDTLYQKIRLLKADYQRQLDSILNTPGEGKQKWEQMNALSKARNRRLYQLNEQIRLQIMDTVQPKKQQP